MSLTPDEIANKEFLVGLRGYDKDEVRAFLGTVAAQVSGGGSAPAAEAAPASTSGGTDWSNLGDEIAAVLRTAHEQAATLRADAENEVKAQRQQTETEAAATRAEAAAFAESARAEAEQHRSEAASKLASAQDEALGLVADAQRRAEVMLETSKVKAKEEAEASVAELTGQIGTLTEARDTIRLQLQDLRGRLDKALASAETPAS